MSQTFKIVSLIFLTITFTIGCLLGLLFGEDSKAYAAENWKDAEIGGIEGAQYATLLNSNNTLYISYADSNHGGKVTVKKYNGNVWESVGSEGFSEGPTRYPSLAAVNGELYVTYLHNTNAVMKQYVGGSWETVWTETNASDEFPPFLKSINGKKYWAYARAVKVGGTERVHARVMENEGNNNWEEILDASNQAGNILNVALASQNGKVKVVLVWPSNMIHVYIFNGRQQGTWWSFEEQYSMSSRNPIAAAADDTNHSSYFAIVDMKDSSIKVYMDIPGYNNSSMSSPGRSGTDEGTHALDMDVKDGIPYIAYIDSNSGKATVKVNAGNWEALGNEAFSKSDVKGLSLSIVSGTTYVAATDSSGSSTVYRMASTPPLLSTSATSSDVAKAIEIMFTDDPTWRQKIKAIKDEKNRRLSYTVDQGKITIKANELTATGHTLKVTAIGYTDTSVKILSDNTDLSNIVLDSGSLNETFDSTKTNYTQNVSHNVTSIQVTPIATDATATVTVNGNSVLNGQTSTPISLQAGSNTITIVVTAQTGTTKTYVIQVNQMSPSTNADLSSLTLSSGPLNESFDPAKTSYTHNVVQSVTSIQVTPIVTDATATITVNNNNVQSGQASAPIPLQAGSNIITIVVTAQSGATKTYTIQVEQFTPSTNADLSNLTVSSGPLNESFDPAKTSYTHNVVQSVTSIQVTPIVTDATATITVNNNNVQSGQASAPIPLQAGNNIISVVVTAQDGTTKTYTVQVNRRGPSTNADLGNLTLSSGPLNETFYPAKTFYTQFVENRIESLTVNLITADIRASVTVNGLLVPNGHVSSTIPLTIGSNIILIEVTAEDGMTTKKYTIHIDRQDVMLPQPPTYYAVTGVSLNYDELRLTEGGEKVVLQATIQPSYATNSRVKWSSSNPEVAAVDENGVVTPLTAGIAMITVTTVDQNKSTTILVKVEKDSETVTTEPEPAPKPTPEPEQTIEFSDVSSDFWAYKEIQDLVSKGIIQGYPNDEFRPNESIRREHMILMITRLGRLTEERDVLDFTDVPLNHVYYNEIRLAQRAGIIDGQDGAFHPKSILTRAQAVKIIALTFNIDGEGEKKFKDVPADAWYAPYVNALANEGILLGDDEYFKPNAALTRAQFAALLYRTLQLTES